MRAGDHHVRPDPRLRFRLYVDGRVVHEAWIDSTTDDADAEAKRIGARQTAMADAATAAGLLWIAETYDPAGPPDRGYVRFGTDPAGMVDPQPANGPPVWR